MDAAEAQRGELTLPRRQTHSSSAPRPGFDFTAVWFRSPPVLNHKTLDTGTGGEGSKKEQKGQIGKWCRPPMTGEGGGSWLDPMGRGAWFTEQTRGPGEPVRGGVQDRGRPKGNLGGVRTDGGG